MNLKIKKERNRKTISMILSADRKTDPWRCLTLNLGHPIRHAMDLSGQCHLLMDLPLEQEKTASINWDIEITRAQKDWKCGKWPKDWNPTRQLGKDEFPVPGELECDVYADGAYYMFIVRLPLFLFQNNQAVKADKTGQTTIAPALYGCYVNTRIHFGNLFFSKKNGWGLCMTLPRKSNYDFQNTMLSRFYQLIKFFKKQAWPNIVSMYDVNLAHEFLIRNGL